MSHTFKPYGPNPKWCRHCGETKDNRIHGEKQPAPAESSEGAMSFDPEKVMHYHGWHVDEDPDDTSDRSFHFVSRADYDKLLALLHDVSSEADPAGTLRELRQAQDTLRALEKQVEELKAEIERLKGWG